jgi:tRNA dimethylallyltransferase
MQVYRGLDVGTGKPSPADRCAVPHHLLDVCDPTETFSAFEFARRARQLMAEIHTRGRLPILVGGTGLYLRAFLKGQLAGEAGDPAIRARLRAEATGAGGALLHDRLRQVDPASAAAIRPGDVFRLVRALELWELTGVPPSAIRRTLWDPPRVGVSAFLILMREREELYRAIDARAQRMWADGLVAEVRGLVRAGYAPTLRPLQALGYRQAAAVVAGQATEAAALAEMQRATRNYAKRQVTWFRREPTAEWVTVRGDDWVDSLAASIVARLAGAAAGADRPQGDGPAATAGSGG